MCGHPVNKVIDKTPIGIVSLATCHGHGGSAAEEEEEKKNARGQKETRMNWLWSTYAQIGNKQDGHETVVEIGRAHV